MKTLRTKEDLLAVFLKGKLHPNNIFLYFAFILPFLSRTHFSTSFTQDIYDLLFTNRNILTMGQKHLNQFWTWKNPFLSSDNKKWSKFEKDGKARKKKIRPSEVTSSLKLLQVLICKKAEDEPAFCRSRYKLLQIIETMPKILLLSKDGAIVKLYANHVARITDQHVAEKSRQGTIRYYFPIRSY